MPYYSRPVGLFLAAEKKAQLSISREESREDSTAAQCLQLSSCKTPKTICWLRYFCNNVYSITVCASVSSFCLALLVNTRRSRSWLRSSRRRWTHVMAQMAIVCNPALIPLANSFHVFISRNKNCSHYHYHYH